MGYSDDGITIASDRLVVEAAAPGTLYRGSRFDWTGFVTRITLDGNHTFCVPESPVPGKGSGGHGLCGEFGIDAAIGYAEAGIGGRFPKLGVGLLTKTDDGPYDFFRPYEVDPFEFEVSRSETSVLFTVRPRDCNGYAASFEKRLTVDGATLLVEYGLTNAGTKPIATTEYCHNFLGPDGSPVDSSCSLRFPYEPHPESVHPAMIPIANGFSWKDAFEGEFYVKFRPGISMPGHVWELETRSSAVIESDSFLPCMIAVWGARHVVSPEVFIALDLKPGDTKEWARTYTFIARTHR